MATDSFVQVAIDGAGKKIRNFFNVIGADTVYQQVVTLAKSDGTLLDSGVPITAAALPLPAGAATDAGPLANLDVAVSTLLKPGDTLTKVATVDTITNPVAVTGTFFQTTQPISGSVSIIGEALESQRTQRAAAARSRLTTRRERALRRIGRA